MRTLVFEPLDARYERLYASLVNALPGVGGNPGQGFVSRQAQKVHGKLLDKLESIGQQKAPVDASGAVRPYFPDELRFYITVAGGTLLLEEEEYRTAKERCEAMVPHVHPTHSRALERTITWLEGLPEQSASDVAALMAPAAAQLLASEAREATP